MSDPTDRTAPTAMSRPSVASAPMVTERERTGSSRISRRHGASACAPPRPPATTATRNGSSTASASDGAASELRAARASAPDTSA